MNRSQAQLLSIVFQQKLRNVDKEERMESLKFCAGVIGVAAAIIFAAVVLAVCG